MAKDLSKYPFDIRPLSREDGGGYLISFSDFNECVSDGETIEEAVKNGLDALAETVAALEDMGKPVPEPGSGAAYSGKLPLRISKSLHARLAKQAHLEGVSMNSLIQEFVAEGMGIRRRKERRNPATGKAGQYVMKKDERFKIKKSQSKAS